MLENFQLAAIVKEHTEMRLMRVPLRQPLQRNLAHNWNSQHIEFIEGINEIDFDPGYKPEQHEHFCIMDYDPPDWLSDEDSQTAANLKSVSADDALMDSICGLVALARTDDEEEMMLFQNFTRSKIIRPGFSLILQGGTYTSTDRAGLVIDSRLSAAYFPARKKLLFHNFRNVNTFLPLSDYYREASEQEIGNVLAHPSLAAEDRDALAVDASQWTRRRFAMLRDSRILDRFAPNEIRIAAQGYGVSIRMSNGKIVVPSDLTEAHKLLQFLCEERFRGALTDTLYETNSKKRADG